LCIPHSNAQASSWKAVSRAACKLREDGVTLAHAAADENLQQLAALGGGDATHVERDAYRRLGTPDLLKPVFIPLPVVIKKKPQTVLWPILPPHHVMAYLEQDGRLSDLVGDLNLDSFWAKASSQDWHRNPDLNDAVHCIPVKVFGDDAGAYKEYPVCVISWSGLSHPSGSTLDAKLLFCAIPTARHHVTSAGNLTLQAVGAYLAWSLNQMEVGIWPANDPFSGQTYMQQGSRIASQWSAKLVMFTGDLKFYAQWFRFAGNYQRINVCFYCAAKKSRCEYRFCGGTAWQDTRVSTEQYLETCRQPFCLTLRGFSLSMVQLDLLHVIYLGLGEDVCASALLNMNQPLALLYA
jgi:hypothetical protein